MREAKETWIDGKHIGHLFLDGKEIKEMWLDGELIYQLLGGYMKIIQFPAEVYGDDVCKIGEYIVLYSTGLVVRAGGSFSVFRFKDGEYVDSIKICDVTQQSVFTVRSFRTAGFLYITDGNKMFIYSENGVSEFEIPIAIKPMLNSYTMCVYANNRLYFADKYITADDENERAHLCHTIISATLNNGIITDMNANKVWGISADKEIISGQMALDIPIVDSITIDYSTGRMYGRCVTHRINSVVRYQWCEVNASDSGFSIMDRFGNTQDTIISDGGSAIYSKASVGNLSYIPGQVGYNRLDHAGETYNTMLKDVDVWVRYNAGAVDYSTAEMSFVWIPFSHVAYDEIANKYYGIGGYTTYKGFHDGMYQIENPDAGGIWYAQEPNWEQVVEADEPRIAYENSNNSDCISDGTYVVSSNSIYYFSKGE